MPGGWKPGNAGPNRYSSTPRKIFDKHVDRVEAKRQRDREDHRADLKALISRMVNLETQLTNLGQHVLKHCQAIDDEGEHAENDTRDS